MGKLHELLAVEPSLKAEAQRVVSQVKGVFTSGVTRLIGQVRSYQPLEEGGEQFDTEITNLATTTETELARIAQTFGAWLDAAMQKETTNQNARADVVLDGKPFLEDLPATALLNLETKLADLRQVYAAIVINDPTVKWQWDEQQGHFASRPRITYRTKKVPRAHILYEATPEHPAQVEMYHEDIRVGTWTAIIRSGAFTPQEQQARLARLDSLLRAVKQARQRANTEEIIPVRIAEKIFGYINSG